LAREAAILASPLGGGLHHHPLVRAGIFALRLPFAKERVAADAERASSSLPTSAAATTRRVARARRSGRWRAGACRHLDCGAPPPTDRRRRAASQPPSGGHRRVLRG